MVCGNRQTVRRKKSESLSKTWDIPLGNEGPFSSMIGPEAVRCSRHVPLDIPEVGYAIVRKLMFPDFNPLLLRCMQHDVPRFTYTKMTQMCLYIQYVYIYISFIITCI